MWSATIKKAIIKCRWSTLSSEVDVSYVLILGEFIEVHGTSPSDAVRGTV